MGRYQSGQMGILINQPALIYWPGMAKISQDKLSEIRKYYYQMGWSMREIAEKFDVDLDAVCYFMRKNNLNRRPGHETNKMIFVRKPPSFSLLKQLTEKQNKLRLIGSMLYWAEGAKRSKIVDFTNSDIKMCRLFMRFLREICGIDENKLRVYLYCHENQNPGELTLFWSRLLKIPKVQFTKPYICKRKQDRAKKREERMKYGLVHIRYGDLKLLNQIKEWIDEVTIYGSVPKRSNGADCHQAAPDGNIRMNFPG